MNFVHIHMYLHTEIRLDTCVSRHKVGFGEGLYDLVLPCKVQCRETGSNPGPLGTSGDDFTTAPDLRI
jgi:hypothetical protein